jgi:hypothetical protein
MDRWYSPTVVRYDDVEQIMTLSYWLGQSNESPIQNGNRYPFVVIPDNPLNPLRSQLWELEDYRVTSVAGGAIWLMPK